MAFPGRLYKGANTYLAIYNFFPDIYTKAPPSIEDNCERVAHVTYAEGGKRSGIDIFLLKKEMNIPEIQLSNTEITAKVIERYKLNPPKTIVSTDEETLDNLCNVHYDFINGAPEEVKTFAAGDIMMYVEAPAKNPKGRKINHPPEIIPVTEIKKINYDRGILAPGKQEFFGSCILEANIDFSKGCVSGWIPGENASFDGSIFKGYFLSPWQECSYCYAKPKHKSFPKTIYNLDTQQLKEELLGKARLTTGSDEILGRPINVLRFGKRTEAGSKLTREQLIQTLETCAETKTRGVIPTKFLEFDNEVAQLLKKTKSTVLYSIGDDKAERGPYAYGCTNNWRIEQAIKYREAGANSVFYLTILGYLPPGEREKKVFDTAEKNHVPIQLLPMRFLAKETVSDLTETKWDCLKGQNGCLYNPDAIEFGAYEQMGKSKALILKDIDLSLTKLIQDNSGNIRMCHHNSELGWCGACFLDEGSIEETPKRELRQVEKTKRSEKKKKMKHPEFKWI
jgi:hypothetical protein